MINQRVLKASGGVELQFHAFFRSELHAYVKLTACKPKNLVEGIGGVDPLILNLGTKSMQVLSLRSLCLYHRYVFERRLGEPQSPSGRFREKKISLTAIGNQNKIARFPQL